MHLFQTLLLKKKAVHEADRFCIIYWLMECGLISYRKLRNICKCICFGSVFLWILIATSYKQYFPRDSGGGNELHHGDGFASPGTRKLLNSVDYKLSSNEENYTIDVEAEVSSQHFLIVFVAN